VLIQRQAVREEKTRHVPYKYKALGMRKVGGGEERRRKRQGRDRKKKGAENRGTKNQRKREPITKKH